MQTFLDRQRLQLKCWNNDFRREQWWVLWIFHVMKTHVPILALLLAQFLFAWQTVCVCNKENSLAIKSLKKSKHSVGRKNTTFVAIFTCSTISFQKHTKNVCFATCITIVFRKVAAKSGSLDQRNLNCSSSSRYCLHPKRSVNYLESVRKVKPVVGICSQSNTIDFPL